MSPAPPSEAAIRAALLADLDQTSAQLAELKQALLALIEATEGANTDDEHDPEGATIAFERAQLDAVLALATRRYDAIDAAGERLDAGTYGRCATCGLPIAPERLLARPTATSCFRCAERAAERR